MELSVTDYDIVRLLTNDKILCQNWKTFAKALGLAGVIDQLERKYFQYSPVEDISILMMEKWEAASGGVVPDLLNILRDLGHNKAKSQIQEFIAEIENARKLKPLESDRRNTTTEEVRKIRISVNETGYSYEQIFGEYFDPTVTTVVILDPHFQSNSQLNNLDHFLSVLLGKCPNLLKINLVTSFDDRKDKGHFRKLQMETLAGFAMKLKTWTNKSINLVVTYDQSLYLQPRLIQLDNGWTFYLEKGLDFYYSIEQASEHWTNLEIRKCRQNTITCIRSS